MKKNVDNFTYESKRNLYNEVINNPNIIKEVKKNIYLKDVLRDFDKISTINSSSNEYKKLQNRIINVDEFHNVSV